MWSKEYGSYMDIQTDRKYELCTSSSGDQIYRLLTQDVSYYLIAITANTVNDSYKHVIYEENELQEQNNKKNSDIKKLLESLHQRAVIDT